MFYIADNTGSYYGEYQRYNMAKAALADILSARPDLEAYELEVITPDADEVAERIRNAGEWDMDDCRELCTLAGLEEEWAKPHDEVGYNTFEKVVFEAADILGVEII